MERNEMDVEGSLPTQQEIDSVAHYTQAAFELKRCALFIEEHRTLGISGMPSDGPVTYNLPDAIVRDAAVMPFRKMWMTREPSQFGKVSNTVGRRWPAAMSYVRLFKKNFKQSTSGFLSDVIFRFNPHNITPDQVVNLWLNCRLAHVGGTNSDGKLSRADFVRESNRLGAAKFEYLFVESIWTIGLSFIGFSQITSRLLAKWDTEGFNPSFVMDDIGSQNSGPEQNGDRVHRSTPGVTVHPHDLSMRLSLLRRRKALGHINYLLDLLEQGGNDSLALLRNSHSIEELIANANAEMRCVASTEGLREGFNAFSIVADDVTNAVYQSIRKGLLFRYGERSYVAAGAAKEILDEQLVSLREELFPPTATSS